MIVAANWQCILLDGGSGGIFRIKRRVGYSPPVQDSGVDSPGVDSWTKTANPKVSYQGRDYFFAFWSLVAQDSISGQKTAQIQGSVHANESHEGGSWTITAKAYYIQGDGTGHGSGVFIDAFDVQAGDFIGDDFVDVKPDASGSITTAANNGYVDTASLAQAITITAKRSMPEASIPPAGGTITTVRKDFAYWLPLTLTGSDPAAPPTVDGNDIAVHRRDLVVAFAFYNEVSQTIVGPDMPQAYDPWWWIVTHWGKVPPGPPPVWIRELYASLLLAVTTSKVSPGLRSDVLDLVVRQLGRVSSAMKKEIKGQERKR